MLTASLENSCYTERRNILSVTQNRMKQVLGKLSRGSILAYSLILLGIVLVASIGMMSASVTNLKSVSSSDKSINAFQIADSGSQAVVRMLKEAAGNELQDISGVTCDGSDAVVESPANFLGGKYKAIFLDSDGKTLACNDNISAVASVKSVGTYSDTARAVQVAVAAGCTPGTTRIVISSNSSAFNNSDNNPVQSVVNGSAEVLVGAECRHSGAVFSTAYSSTGMIPDQYGVTSSGIRDPDFNFSIHCSTAASRCFMTKIDSSGSITGSDLCDQGWKIFALCLAP